MATGTVYPNADGSTVEWTTQGSSNHWENIDEDPDSPNDSDYNWTSSDADQDEVAMDTISGVSTVTEVEVYARGMASGAGGDDIQAQIYMGGSWQTAKSFGFTSSASNKTVSWTGSWSQSDMDALQVRFIAGIPIGGSVTVYAMEANITYTLAAGGNSYVVLNTDEIGPKYAVISA